MIRKLKFLLFFTMLINSININSQHKMYQIELPQLRTESKDFITILDNIITHEKTCKYYDADLMFSIRSTKLKDRFVISVESANDINILLPNRAYGYFRYKKHLFIVIGDYCGAIFSYCNKKLVFEYMKYSDQSFNINTDKEITIYSFVNDSFSQWHYFYIRSKFILDEKSTKCD